jgi:hypothetical protein
MIDLRLPTGFPTTSTTRLAPLPSPPCPPPSGPQSGTESTGTSPGPPGGARRPFVAPPVCVGRNVYPAAAAAHALRPLRRQPVGALVHSVAGMRSNVLEPHRRAIGPQGRVRCFPSK